MEGSFNGDGWGRGRNDPMEDAPIIDERFIAELDAIERMYNQGNVNTSGIPSPSFLQRGASDTLSSSSFYDRSSNPSYSYSPSPSTSSVSPSRFTRPTESGPVPPLPAELWTDITERTPASSLLAVSLISKENRQIALRNANERRRMKLQRVLEIMEWEREMAELLRNLWGRYIEEESWRDAIQDPSLDQGVASLSYKEVMILLNEDHFLSKGSTEVLMKLFRRNMEGEGHPIVTRLRMLYEYLACIMYITAFGKIMKAWSMVWEIDRIILSTSKRTASSSGGEKYILTISLDNEESTPSYKRGDATGARPVLRIRIPQPRQSDDPYSPSDPSSRPFVSRYSPASALVTICSRMSGILFSYVMIE